MHLCKIIGPVQLVGLPGMRSPRESNTEALAAHRFAFKDARATLHVSAPSSLHSSSYSWPSSHHMPRPASRCSSERKEKGQDEERSENGLSNSRTSGYAEKEKRSNIAEKVPNKTNKKHDIVAQRLAKNKEGKLFATPLHRKYSLKRKET